MKFEKSARKRKGSSEAPPPAMASVEELMFATTNSVATVIEQATQKPKPAKKDKATNDAASRFAR